MNGNSTSVDSVMEFIYREARLLDQGRFIEWHALFEDDGVYWMPTVPGQMDRAAHATLMNEDRLMLKLRIDRLKQPRAHSQQPESRSMHVLQQPAVSISDNGTYSSRTAMIYTEYRGSQQLMLAATAFHELVRHEGVLKIREKRVELLSCDGPLQAVQLFI